jgi:hypothetical protein
MFIILLLINSEIILKPLLLQLMFQKSLKILIKYYQKNL